MRASNRCGVCGIVKAPGKHCLACSRRRNAEYKRRNSEKVRAARSAYKKAAHAAGADDRAIRKAARRVLKPLKRVVARAKWKAANKGAVNATTAMRFAAKMRAIPVWSERFIVGEIYDLAVRRSLGTGIAWHVDHVVPLRSRLVCGLHCESNLRVIPGIENMRKNNKTWPDMP